MANVSLKDGIHSCGRQHEECPLEDAVLFPIPGRKQGARPRSLTTVSSLPSFLALWKLSEFFSFIFFFFLFLMSRVPTLKYEEGQFYIWQIYTGQYCHSVLKLMLIECSSVNSLAGPASWREEPGWEWGHFLGSSSHEGQQQGCPKIVCSVLEIGYEIGMTKRLIYSEFHYTPKLLSI